MKNPASNNKDAEKKNGSGSIILIVILLFLTAVSVWFCVQKKTSPHVEIARTHEPVAPEPSFDDFISVWNGIVRSHELTDAHLLSSVNNEKLIATLSGYIVFYSHPLPNSVSQPLNEIVQEYPGSLWHYYLDFLTDHIGKRDVSQPLRSKVLSTSELKSLVLQTTGQPGMDESVKLILGASDPCAYFNIYKYDLWKNGLSRNMQSCGADIVDSNKFPSLAALIKE